MGHDAMYWLKWRAGNDVRERASGVGRRGWNVVCVGVLHVALEYILLPPLPLLHSDLVLGQQWLPPSRHAMDLLCCVCANVDGVPLQKSVKITNGFSLYFAILMGVRVHSSCFAYSEAPNCSLPGALELQSSWKCP